MVYLTSMQRLKAAKTVFEFASEKVDGAAGYGFPFALLCISLAKISLEAMRCGSVVPEMNRRNSVGKVAPPPSLSLSLSFSLSLSLSLYFSLSLSLSLSRALTLSLTPIHPPFLPQVLNDLSMGMLLEFYALWRAESLSVERGDFQVLRPLPRIQSI